MPRFLSVLLAAALAAPTAFADAPADAGREILAKYQDAVVHVRLVLKITISRGGQAQTQEQKVEATGTVLDSSGLTLVSLSQTDPGALMSARLPAGVEMTSDVSDAAFLYPDGKEIPAKIVLRDKDLDMAFVRPAEKLAAPAAAVALAQDAKLRILDEVVILSRLGKIASRVPSVTLNRIASIVEKPRTFYNPEGPGANSLGAPAFTLDGKLIGVILLRSLKTEGRVGAEPPMAIILPVADILESAKQAPEEAKAAAEKTAEPEKKSEGEKAPETEKKEEPKE
ncbi:MAG: serine protease [Planctomycetota bacterium]